MDDRVIEAAAKAYYAEQSRRFGTHDHPPEILFEDPKETERAIFTAAINAALRELAPDIRAAVERLIEATIDGVRRRPEGVTIPEILAKSDLFATIGIEEDTP